MLQTAIHGPDAFQLVQGLSNFLFPFYVRFCNHGNVEKIHNFMSSLAEGRDMVVLPPFFITCTSCVVLDITKILNLQNINNFKL